MSKLDYTTVINTMDSSNGSQDSDNKNCNQALEEQLLEIFNSYKPPLNKKSTKVVANAIKDRADKIAKEIKYSDEGNIVGEDVLLTKRPRIAHSSTNVRNFCNDVKTINCQ